ncbi:MAG: NAD(P)/FAD-dependent oxidoreductase [Muribaculaceae bacterium]|nr:NAD(P)/FAD-dependent oxidoreductase [Muribaculaceae bacterium]
MDTKKHIVIIGGGFAGLNLVKHLDRHQYRVTLIDRNNYHSFPPLFYQIASSGLDVGSISFPFRRELYRKLGARGNVTFLMDTARSVDPATKTVACGNTTVSYDILVIAHGTTNNFFNMPELERHVFTLKSTSQALRCRNEILERLERASTLPDSEQRRRLLSFVVIGGGPTGVEIAGAIGEMKRYILHREYPAIGADEVKVTLLEGNSRVLASMSEKSSEQALKYLSDLMVKVETGVSMTSYHDNTVHLSDGRTIDSEMVIWTAGVTGEKLEIAGGPERGHGNRLIVNKCNAVIGLEDIYALGDVALMPDADPNFPKGHPQLAQVAIQQSRLLAFNLNTGSCRPFRYNDKGTMATVGRNRAVVDLGHTHFGGFPAWATWMFVHLISILGMRNKITVLINWIWAYFSYQTSLRLIVRPDRYPLRRHWEKDN